MSASCSMNNRFNIPNGFKLVQMTDDRHGHAAENIEHDDDVELWLIRTPVSFNFSVEKNVKIDLKSESSCRLLESDYENVENESIDDDLLYKIHQNISEDVKSTTLVLHDKESSLKPVKKKLTGQITISRTLDVPEISLAEKNATEKTLVPEGLQQRFIPFGCSKPANEFTVIKKNKKRKSEQNDGAMSFNEVKKRKLKFDNVSTKSVAKKNK